jgi:hypothetical protein
MNVKQKYNELLKRYNNAEVYFARRDISIEEKQAQAIPLQRLVNEMSEIIDLYDLTDEQILNGFAEE